jgi:hypothetical protein
MTSRIQRMRSKLQSPSLKQISQGLKTGGEFGRAVPGATQAQVIQDSTPGAQTPVIPTASGRTEMFTHFTTPGTDFLLYQAESWVKLRFILETAGPVAIGTRDSISPVLSGKGILLSTGVEFSFYVGRGARVTISSTAINRVSFIVEPIPWLEQIATLLGRR